MSNVQGEHDYVFLVCVEIFKHINKKAADGIRVANRWRTGQRVRHPNGHRFKIIRISHFNPFQLGRGSFRETVSRHRAVP